MSQNLISFQYLEKGTIEGWDGGEIKGPRLMLARQLTRKFGPLSYDAVARLLTSSESERLGWSDRVLTARTLDEIFT